MRMNPPDDEALQVLCSERKQSFAWIASLSNWTAEVYGLGVHLRRYAFYPKWLPLCVNTDHGPGFRDAPLASELAVTAPVQLYHSFARVRAWRAVSRKPCHCLYSPYIFYRRQHGIDRAPDAAGTLAFPAHTTGEIDDVSNIELYIRQLKALPDACQPVSICLHMTDIGKGLHRKFIEHGYAVYSAGHVQDDRFTERFYQILRQFKYATSNTGGAYLYYCVEMGIPFFLYGNEPIYINKSDANIEKGVYTSYKSQASYIRLLELFSAVELSITEEQRLFVENGLGLHQGLGRWKLAAVLYFSLIKNIFSLRWWLNIARRLGKKC